MSLVEQFRGWFNLQKDINKQKGDEREKMEGVVSSYQDKLDLDMSDEELLHLTSQWEHDWYNYYDENLRPRQKSSEEYWRGVGSDDTNLSEFLKKGKYKPKGDNIIYEALETYLPIATRQRPEPVVNCDDTEEGIELSKKVEKMLIFQADKQKIKLKLKDVVRRKELHLLGVMKVGWDKGENDIICKVLKTPDLILDPDAYVEYGEYKGEYIGERRSMRASKMIIKFPQMKDYIEEQAQNRMGTKLQYTEWWTDEYVCWRLKDKILGKKRNPHWNYDSEEEETVVDEYGTETVEKINKKGENHFPTKKKPYCMLVDCSLGDHPHNETSLIEQNISNQEKINRRNTQIEQNIENINGCWVISLAKAGLDASQVESLARKLQKGGVAGIPNGSPREAIDKVTGLALPADVYNERDHAELKLRNVFGVTGLTPQGTVKENTVRGKILVRGQDADRVGGGVSEYLEQFADYLYNWMVQLMYVYYTEEHSASILGGENGRQFITLKKTDFNRQLSVSVKEGSMIPKDSLTRRNEAVDLFTAGAMDPLTLFENLDFPDPKGALEKLIMWQTNPQGLIQGGGMINPMQPQVSPEGVEAGAGGLVEGSPTGDINQNPELLKQVPPV